jgi:hypothetical protein
MRQMRASRSAALLGVWLGMGAALLVMLCAAVSLLLRDALLSWRRIGELTERI